MDRTDIGTLLIPNIKMSDSGTYMCVGSNSIGSNSAPIKVVVFKGEVSTSWNKMNPLQTFGDRFRGCNVCVFSPSYLFFLLDQYDAKPGPI